jgi:hypothetical protein
MLQLGHLEPSCCKKRQKSPNQETDLGNREHLKVLNDTKLVLNDPLNHLGSIWYHSEPSDVPYSPNQFLALNFFAASYSKTALAAKPFKKGLVTLIIYIFLIANLT